MEETTLLDHFAAIDQSHGFSQSPTAIAHDGLPSSFQGQPALLQSLQEFLPLEVLFAASDSPIEQVASAIGPKSEGHSHHHMPPPTLLSPPASLVDFDRLLLVDNGQPDPIKLVLAHFR